MEAVFLTFILMLSIFLGFELINKVPATLHTPLMSGANAISGITVVGAVALAGTGEKDLPTGSAPAPWPWPRSTWSAATW
jgi:NAD(P) transhydrogenase subunit alpha